MCAAFIAALRCSNPAPHPRPVLSEPTGGTPGYFSARFPQAKDVDWDTLENNTLSFTFSDGKNDCKALFDPEGAFLSLTTLIEAEALPDGARKFIADHYPSPDFSVIQRYDSANIKVYQLELQTGSEYVNLDFDLQGKLLRETKLPLSQQEMKDAEEEGVDK